MTPRRWVVSRAGIAPFHGVPTRFDLGGVWLDGRLGGDAGRAAIARHGVEFEEMLAEGEPDAKSAPARGNAKGRSAPSE